jgi:lipopolysaccharide/colanic/teichoic acid biosynthesis glycosyltransferase
LLLLVEADTTSLDGHKHKFFRKVASALCSSTRDTDIAGWYEQDSALAVLYTELGEAEKRAVLEAIRARVESALRSQLSEDEIKWIRLSFTFFPASWEEGDRGPQPPLKLYPELKEQNSTKRWFHLLKRTMDILGSSLALIFCSPFFLVIALGIKLTSRGPILFRQERVGRFGRRFTFLKFRTMYVGSDEKVHRDYVRRLISGELRARRQGSQEVVYKLKDDPRVTPVGRLLRKTSLDELPQLWNVLKGEMSLVGPRPPIPYEVNAYDIWHRRRVLEAKPGITGLWQVNGRSRTSFDEMVRLDLRYARDSSLWLDVKILLQTPWAVVSGQGAY